MIEIIGNTIDPVNSEIRNPKFEIRNKFEAQISKYSTCRLRTGSERCS
jgi:hypothetical protein